MSGVPDGLDPPGEQLGLFPDPGMAEIIVHRVTVTGNRWACTCGAGRVLVPGGYAHAAALAHVRAVRRRMAQRPDKP